MSRRKDSNPDQTSPEEHDDEKELSHESYYYDDSTGYETYDTESETGEATETEDS